MQLEAEAFQKSPCAQTLKIAGKSRFLGFFADFCTFHRKVGTRWVQNL